MRASLAAVLALATPVAAQTWDRDLRPAVTIAGHERERFTLAERMAHWRVRGVSVAVVDGCRVVEARGFGTATAAGAPVTPATLFQAASISKPVTAVAALRLVEQGRLTLDGDIRAGLRRWTLPGTAPVTLRALLNHTAGVGVASFPGYVRGAPLPTVPQILDGVAPANTPAVRVDGAAGTWRYSGGGYEIAQALLEDATAEPFAELVDRLVLRPAGMTDSAFDQPLAPDRVIRAASGFDDRGVRVPGGSRTHPELAAAGLWTTPTDIARFAIAVAQSGDRSGLLTTGSARAMLVRGPGGWGLGVDLGREDDAPHFAHSGANAGFTSDFILYRDGCRGAVVMTNSDDARWLIAETLRAIGDAYAWPDRVAPPVRAVVPVTPAIARRFTGTWRLRDVPGGRFAIARRGGGLTFARVGHGTRDLVADSDRRLFSPDMPGTITASSPRAVATQVIVTLDGHETAAVRER